VRERKNAYRSSVGESEGKNVEDMMVGGRIILKWLQ
jgi:hypothetical protein